MLGGHLVALEESNPLQRHHTPYPLARLNGKQLPDHVPALVAETAHRLRQEVLLALVLDVLQTTVDLGDGRSVRQSVLGARLGRRTSPPPLEDKMPYIGALKRRINQFTILFSAGLPDPKSPRAPERSMFICSDSIGSVVRHLYWVCLLAKKNN